MPSVPVWDVLAMLPLDVVVDNIWAHLSHADRHSLQLACKDSMHLANSVVTAATFDFSKLIDDPLLDPNRWIVAPHWIRCASHLTRLPRLSRLSFTNWTRIQHVITALEACRAATQGRVTGLRLVEAGAAPGEDEWADQADERRRRARWSRWTMRASVSLCTAFPHLTELDLRLAAVVFTEVVEPLTGCTQLTRLVLPCLDIAQQPLTYLALTKLTGLQHLAFIGAARGAPQKPLSLVDVSELFSLTALTHLEVQSLIHSSDDDSPPCPPGPLRAALASLASMTRLRCLRTCRDQARHSFNVDDAVFAAVRQLSCLTELVVSRFELTEPPTPPLGHLPALQVLGVDSCMFPSQLLHTLLPLLPLPSLRRIGLHRLRSHLCLLSAACDENGWVMATESTALRELCRHLEGAPSLQLDRLELQAFTTMERNDSPQLQISLDGLRPLLPRFTELCLLDFVVEVRVAVEVLERLPNLRSLELGGCSVSDAGMALIGSMLQSVTQLVVQGERRVGDDEYGLGQLSDDGFLALAASRRLPLQLVVRGRGVTRALRDECDAMQLRCFNRQNIDWDCGLEGGVPGVFSFNHQAGALL